MSATPILIATMPRYVSIPRLRTTTADNGAHKAMVTIAASQSSSSSSHSSASMDHCQSDDSSSSALDEFLVRGKKRRLDHLSWEEKFQRKKLKNRVAAQTSRDRKKAKLEEMEAAIQQLADQNDALQSACHTLKQERDRARQHSLQLEQKIAQLTQRLNDHEAATAEVQQQQQQQQQQQRAVDVAARLSGCGSQPHGSAESFPLPQEREPQSTRRSAVDDTPSNSSSSNSSSTNSTTASLLKIIALCLLYKTYSNSSTPAGSKSSPKVCSQMSSQTWQKILHRAARELPRMKAPQSECLDQWWGPRQNSWNPPQIAVV